MAARRESAVRAECWAEIRQIVTDFGGVDYAFAKARQYGDEAKQALAEGRTPQEILTDGLIAGMSVVGEDFKHNILYVPEVLIAARAMKAGMAVLKPLLSASDDSERIGTLLMVSSWSPETRI